MKKWLTEAANTDSASVRPGHKVDRRGPEGAPDGSYRRAHQRICITLVRTSREPGGKRECLAEGQAQMRIRVAESKRGLPSHGADDALVLQ